MSNCKGKKRDGSPCPVAVRPSGFCWIHDPELAEQRATGRRQGGKTRSKPAAVLPPDAPDVEVRDMPGIVTLLVSSINDVRKGCIDPKIANAIGFLATVLLRALEGSQLAKQVEEQARILAELKAPMEVIHHEHGNASSPTGQNGMRNS